MIHTIHIHIPEDEIPEDSVELLKALLTDQAHQTAAKFIRGQKEHKGNLMDRDCLLEAYYEAIDLFVYLQTELYKKIIVIDPRHDGTQT